MIIRTQVWIYVMVPKWNVSGRKFLEVMNFKLFLCMERHWKRFKSKIDLPLLLFYAENYSWSVYLSRKGRRKEERKIRKKERKTVFIYPTKGWNKGTKKGESKEKRKGRRKSHTKIK